MSGRHKGAGEGALKTGYGIQGAAPMWRE